MEYTEIRVYYQRKENIHRNMYSFIYESNIILTKIFMFSLYTDAVSQENQISRVRSLSL